MTFPTVPRDVSVELYLNGSWIDVTSDVRASDGIQITRGRPNGASQPQPSTCTLTLDNRAGHYSPRNPLGPYYGQLGRNTPIRVSVNTVRDTFTRTSPNEWGFTETGQDWSHTFTGGGSVNDFDVAGGVGTHAVLTVNGFRYTSLRDEHYRDVDVSVKVTLPYADILGGPIATGFILRADPVTNNDYYFADLLIGTTELMTLRIWRADAGSFISIGTSVQVTDFAYTGQALWLRAQIAGGEIRCKVWEASAPEPYGWHIERTSFVIRTAGWVGIRSDVYTGNTNTMPAVFSYDDFTVRSPRFFGEVAAWPQRWDTSGIDVTAPIEAASQLRRLSQGTAALLSTLYRGISGLPTPAVAYWPCEEGPNASSLASAVGGPAMFLTGDTEFAAYDGFPSSYPIPVLGEGASWTGTVPVYTNTGQVQLRFLLHVPTSEPPNNTYFIEITTGNGRTWSVQHQSGGAITIELWEYDTLLSSDGPWGFDTLGRNLLVVLNLEQNGSAIDSEFSVLEVGSNTASFVLDSTPSRTLQRALRVRVCPHAEMTGVAFGHISIRKEVDAVWDVDEELAGFAGETALSRLVRLCDQEGIEFAAIENLLIPTAPVGPMRPLTLMTLLQECADADLGTLVDPRSAPGLLYRERGSLYNQMPVAALDYSGGQVAAPFEPVDDDLATRNDVTVTRTGGGSVHAVLETGRMSVLEPADGGVGRYDEATEINAFTDDQLPDLAGWLLHLGTVDETRYPVVRVNLAARDVAADPVLTAAILDLDIDDQFEITNPRVGETPDTITQIARGYTETIGVFEHSIAINAAPASPYQTIRLDNDLARLSTDGSTLTAGVTSTATSLSVATPSGVLWTTTAGQMPIPIRVGGEVMSVTAIAGTSSPQTFTVTRSVNSIVKAHSAGAVVTLTRDATLAL